MHKITNFFKYIGSLIMAAVQFFTRWAWREEDRFFKTFLKIKQVNTKVDGSVDSQLIMTREDALVICHALVCVFNKDTNFTEVTFQTAPEYTKGWSEDESLVIHIFREKGITPAVLLAATKRERDELQKQLQNGTDKNTD